MELGGRIGWQQLMAREQQWSERLLRSEHPAFGLGTSWSGPRCLGDVHFVRDEVESLGLAHGDPIIRSAPLVQIHTTRLPADRFDAVMARRSGLFPRNPGGPRVAPTPAFEQLSAELDIDGQPTALFGVSADDGWVARASPRPDVSVYIEGHGLGLDAFADHYQVVEITQLAPYLEGRLVILQEAWS